MNNKAVLVYSGGLDSTTLLYKLMNEGWEVHALGVDYGQRHKKELEAATAICGELGVEYKTADLSAITPLLGGSSQTDKNIAVPEGHYTSENMKATVVPNRNMIMISVAAAWAISLRARRVAYAAHAGDHTIYPDCRPEFIQPLSGAIGACDWLKLELSAPFKTLSKAQIVSLGRQLRAPLGKTWSCYKGLEIHCGRCGTCVERKEAFILSGVEDPTEYEYAGN